MEEIGSFSRRLLLIVALAASLSTWAMAQQEVPFDPVSIPPTLIPHQLSPLPPFGSTAPAAAFESSATFAGSPYSVGQTITATTTQPAAEEHIAVDPLHSSNLVAAISDFSLRGGFNTTKVAVSSDNGDHWAEGFIPLVDGLPATSDGLTWIANSDPVVAIDKAGRVFLVDLYINVLAGGQLDDGLYVNIGSISSGVNFTVADTIPVVKPTLRPGLLEDKPWITVDNSNTATSGNVYVSWSRFIGNGDSIVFSRSTDHGQSWSAPIQISPPFQNAHVQGSQVAVGPNGEVYVAYEVFFFQGLRRQFLAKSTDGGVTFSIPKPITPFFHDLVFSSTYRKNSFPALAVSPSNGNVYALYSDQPNASVGAEVEFIRSTNGGSTFSSPVVINDSSTGQQFFPALTVDTDGVVHGSWFDTRNSSTGTKAYDIFAAFSKDGGATFSPNARVTALIDADSSRFIGDYAGIAAGGGFAHPVWTNGGFFNGQLQTATLTLP